MARAIFRRETIFGCSPISSLRGSIAAVWYCVDEPVAGHSLRYRKPYTLRRTDASLLIQAGEPITCVQGQLGHTPGVRALVYAHFVPGRSRVVDVLDDVTGRNLYAPALDENEVT